MARISVSHLHEDAFRVDMRGHRLVVDQPSPHDECGPTPVELFVASLAACAAYYAGRSLAHDGSRSRGPRVECEWTMRAGEPASVGRVRLRVIVPDDVPDDRREALLAAVDRCTVLHSLRRPPQMSVLVDAEPTAAEVAA
jgi:uncharacterized OsmC-like protein